MAENRRIEPETDDDPPDVVMPVVLVAECSEAVGTRWPQLRAGLHHLALLHPVALDLRVVVAARQGVIAFPHPSIDSWLPRRPLDADFRPDRAAVVIARVTAASLVAVRERGGRALRSTVVALVGSVGELSAALQSVADERLRPNLVAVEVAAAGDVRPLGATAYRPTSADTPLEGLFLALAEALQATDDAIVKGAPELVMPSGVQGIERLDAVGARPS